MNPLIIIGWTVATYLIASIPFAVIVGKVLLGKDIRDYGDGNPGATNVRRAGGTILQYAFALFLDMMKSLLPVGIPYAMGWTSWEVMPIAFAAILGHMFPIYMQFKGGKAIAVSGGIWFGLLLWEGMILIPIALIFWYKVVNEDEWAIMLTMLTLFAYLLITRFSEPAMLLIWIGNLMLLIYTHRKGQLTKPPTLRFRNDSSDN
ncbi:MAG: glycerol-3-phosphate acyltransferase [Chloroflexota bacterium]